MPSKKTVTTSYKRYQSAQPLSVRQKKQVKRLINSGRELKHHAGNQSGQCMTQTPTLQDLCVISQGDSDTTRDGDEIIMRSLEFRASVRMLSGADITNQCRIVIFQWKENSTPTSARLFEVGSGINWVNSPFNVDNKSIYRVVYDTTFSLSISGTEARAIKRKFYQKKKFSRKVDFSAGGTSGISGKLYMFYGSDSLAVVHPEIDWYSHLRFTDS